MKVLMKGNEAIAEAAIQSGCKLFFGYPITPQTEVAAYMAKKMPKIDGVYLQAESEVAAINMVLGASAAGHRVMTSSSSPGISLKSEGISYLAGSDLPAVIINVQRGGPGLGGIQPSQADYYQATKGLAHGDFHVLVLAPSTVQEMFDLTKKAFYLADKYRMPAMILADGILGQMMEPLTYGETTEPALPAKDWAASGTEGKRKKNIINSLYLKPEELEQTVFDRFKRYNLIKQTEQQCEEYLADDADILVVAFGATARIAKNAINQAREQGIKVGLLRPITLFPFPSDVFAKHKGHVKAFISAELSMGQLIDDVRLAINCEKPVHLCNRTGGVVLTPDEILQSIEKANA